MRIRFVRWVLPPGVAFGLPAALSPHPERTPWLLRRLRAVANRLDDRRERRRVRRGAVHPSEPDPFEVLNLQIRLAAMAQHVRALEDDPDLLSPGRRLELARAAYDALLTEACRLAEIEAQPTGPAARRRTEPERLADELQLAERGWLW
jgi:hypothetical protein